MSQEKMREEFENELLGMLRANHPEMGVGLNEIVNHRSGSEYESSMFSMAWWAWQASRAAVAVKLPVFEDYPASIDDEMRESLRCAIEGAGLKVQS